MDPLSIAGLATSGVRTLYDLGTGIGQQIKARKIEREMGDRPEFQTPGQIKRATALSEQAYADPRLEGIDIMLGEMDDALATSLGRGRGAAPTSAAYASMIQSGLKSQQDKMAELALASSQQQAQERRELQRRLDIEGRYSQEEFDRNIMQPWMESAASASALRQAGGTNISRALGTAGGQLAQLGGMGIFNGKAPGAPMSDANVDVVVDSLNIAGETVSNYRPELNMIPDFINDPLYGLK